VVNGGKGVLVVVHREHLKSAISAAPKGS
jgi:hypothetical protein